MSHVMIGFAEALPAPEVVFSLLSAGHRVSAFARSGDLPLARLPLDGLHIVPAPETDTAASKGALAALMARPDAPDVVLPLDDAGLWLVHAALGKDTRIAGAAEAAARTALDKTVQIEAARHVGLDVPRTLVWDGTPPGAAAFGDTMRWPAIAKPGLALVERNERLTKGDARYLADPDQIAAFFAEPATDGAPWLIQPLVPGRGEGVFGFATTSGAVVAWSGHRRVRMMNPHGSGASCCERHPPDPALCEKVADFITKIGWRGAFMVELLRDTNGTAWFMELNGRMWGSLALARRQGLEYPAWSVAQVGDPDFAPTPPDAMDTPLTVRHLGREVLHLAHVVRGPKSDFHRPDWPSLAKSAAAVLRPNPARSFYNYDPDFPRYYLADAMWTLRRALRR